MASLNAKLPPLVLTLVLGLFLLAPLVGAGGKGGAKACNDGKDNDGDGKIDYPADPGCTSKNDNNESNAAPPAPACSDGKDNDGDGKTDYPADPGCHSGDDTDEYNPPATYRYFKRADVVAKVSDLSFPLWEPPEAEPTDGTRPTGSEAAQRLHAAASWPSWATRVEAIWPTSATPSYFTAEVWATVAPAAAGNYLQMRWADFAGCIDPIVSCYAPASGGPITLRHVPGTGETLPDGSIVGGQFRSDPASPGRCYQTLGFCYFGLAYVTVGHPTGAGVILYDSAATPSCVAINAVRC